MSTVAEGWKACCFCRWEGIRRDRAGYTNAWRCTVCNRKVERDEGRRLASNPTIPSEASEKG